MCFYVCVQSVNYSAADLEHDRAADLRTKKACVMQCMCVYVHVCVCVCVHVSVHVSVCMHVAICAQTMPPCLSA